MTRQSFIAELSFQDLIEIEDVLKNKVFHSLTEVGEKAKVLEDLEFKKIIRAKAYIKMEKIAIYTKLALEKEEAHAKYFVRYILEDDKTKKCSLEGAHKCFLCEKTKQDGEFYHSKDGIDLCLECVVNNF